MPGVDKGGNIPNLGYVDADTIAKLEDAVFSKEFGELGMPDFTGKLKQEDLENIRAFIQGTARSGQSETSREIGTVACPTFVGRGWRLPRDLDDRAGRR